jgi:hypothetical protein
MYEGRIVKYFHDELIPIIVVLVQYKS